MNSEVTTSARGYGAGDLRPVPYPPARVQAIRWRLISPGFRSKYAIFATDRLRQRVVNGLDTSKDNEDFLLEGHNPTTVTVERWGKHGHAHWLWTETAGYIEDLVLWAPAGLASSQVRRAVAIADLPRYDDEPHGYLGGLLNLQEVGQAKQVLTDLAAGDISSSWQSVTPILTKRHFKQNKDWREIMKRFINDELVHRFGENAPQLIRLKIDKTNNYFTRRWDRNMSPHWSFDITEMVLDQPVSGILCLGALSHFGFGRMAPT